MAKREIGTRLTLDGEAQFKAAKIRHRSDRSGRVVQLCPEQLQSEKYQRG
ncbi:MAG: hypothetical protein NC395_00375 [Prevotella sp.]|nr:hypothetical protein [Prevotella sp.]